MIVTINKRAWRKYKQAEKNFMIHFMTGKRSRRNYRASRKWARAASRWLDRIYEA